MPTFELETVAGPIPEDTVVGAELVSCRIVEKNFFDDDGNKAKKVEWKFVIQEDGSPWDGDHITGETGVRFTTHPDNRLRSWASSIANTEFPPGYRLDTDVLLGMKCRIVTAQREYEKDGEKKRWCFVADVMPARTASVGASPF